MAAPSQPAFSDFQMYPDMANAGYPPPRGLYMFQNPRNDFPPGYGYQNPDLAMTNATYAPNLPVSGSEMASWNQTAIDRWATSDATTFGAVTNPCDAVVPTALLNSDASRTYPLRKHGNNGSKTPNKISRYTPSSNISSPSFGDIESPYSDSVDHLSDGEFTIETAPRKRGRPRHTRHQTDPTNNSTSPHRTRRSNCLPHKQVERKYREGLNMEFERLRRTIPTLPQNIDSNIIGVAKPSKGMVLGAAIEYIKKVEQERDEALDEVQRLGGNVRSGRRKL